MIFIDPVQSNISDASLYHYERLFEMINSRANRIKVNRTQKEFLRTEVLPRLKTILAGSPIQLKRIAQSIRLSKGNRIAVEKLFNYDNWFIKKETKPYNAYLLAKKLDINTCIYCNRNYTSTVEKTTRPQFDHYFPKKKYPLLALSFYNLIPSCSICNSNIKGTKELLLRNHLHPYIDNCLGDFNFSYTYDNEKKDSLASKIVFLKENRKAKRTFDFFKVNEIYNAHNDELRDLIKLRDIFSDRYLEILSKTVLEGTKIGKSELYQLAFGVYLDDNDVSKRPFSKFKKDILRELKIIE